MKDVSETTTVIVRLREPTVGYSVNVDAEVARALTIHHGMLRRDLVDSGGQSQLISFALVERLAQLVGTEDP